MSTSTADLLQEALQKLATIEEKISGLMTGLEEVRARQQSLENRQASIERLMYIGIGGLGAITMVIQVIQLLKVIWK